MSLLRIVAVACVVLTVFAVFPQSSHAQSKRVVLIEEATNASCGPCAAQNPTFQAYLMQPANRGRFVTVIWHAWWPGSDVMYSANTEMNRDRVTYYGVNGVPTSFVNGLNETPPSSTGTIETNVAAAEGMSPITITFDVDNSGGVIAGDVTVETIEAVSNATLRIVAVEGYHYYDNAGSNGEKEFYFIARQMLPSNAGTAVDLAANGTMTVPVSYTINPEFTEEEMFLVAYVQKNDTKEVLQAGQSKKYIEFDGGGMISAYESNANTPRTFSRSFEAIEDGDYECDINTDMLPEGWTVSVTANNSNWQDGALTFTKGESVNVDVTITPTGTIKRYGTVSLLLRGPLASTGGLNVTYYNAPIDVLMFRRDEGIDDIAANYSKGFENAANWNYAIVGEEDSELFDIHEYPIFAMEVGKSILEKEDVDLLKDYLDNGGRLWLLGAEIAWALADDDATTNDPTIYQDEAFMTNYLHAEYVADDPDATTANHSVRGFAGDPIGDGLSFQISGGVRNQNQPDVLKPVNGGVACFYYAKEEDVAGVRYNGNGYAVVYYGFGMEGTTNTSWNRNLYSKTIEWLLGVTSVEGPQQAADGFAIAAYPNPAIGQTRIPVTLNRAQDITVAVYNMYGQKVGTVYEGAARAGTSSYTLDAQNLPAGAYMLRVHAGENVTSTMLSVVK